MADPDMDSKLDLILKRLDQLERRQELYFEQVEALLNLHTMLAPLNAPLPLMRKWAIAPDFGNLLYTLLMDYQPTQIVELGGGVSTVITGYYCAQMEIDAMVNAFDHHPLYASLARQNIDSHQLIDVATVNHAPLLDVEIAGEKWQWYEPTAFDFITEIDFLTVDGPPQQDNPASMARYPALPVLYSKLKSGAIILLDDTHREDEQKVVERWLAEFDLVKVSDVDNEKGAIILQKV